MEDLYRRLPRLLQNRTSWSTRPDCAFPTVIRLTVRLVDPTHRQHRRPFRTTSAQRPIDGRALFMAAITEQNSILKKEVHPLMEKLLSREEVNVTRVNVALSGFQDIPETTTSTKTSPSFSQHKHTPPSSGSPAASQRGFKRTRIDDFFTTVRRSGASQGSTHP